MRKEISIQGVLFDEKSSFLRGSALGPPKIREAYYSESINPYSETGISITDNPRIKFEPDFTPIDYLEDIKNKTLEHILAGRKVLSLGGDHSITYPIIAAHTEHYQNIEILHIDAHSDLYHDFEGDPYSHACPFTRIMENNLASRLVQIGIRCLTPHLKSQGEKYGVEVIEMKDYSLDKIPCFTNPIYISLDLDALDPSYAPGVSHHEPGGLTSRQVIDIIHSIDVPILGADIVEYNPSRDHSEITAALGAKLLKEILAKMLVR